MQQIYVIGDIHTVSAFGLAGVLGMTADPETAPARLEEILGRGDAALVMVTCDLAREMAGRIAEINFSRPSPVVITLPGFDDKKGFSRSVVSYVSEALGVAL